MTRRASGHAAAVAVLLAVAVVVAGGVWVVLAGVAPLSDPPPRAALSLSVSAADDRVALVHRGGDALSVRRLRLRVAVDGTPLAHQPPVPFFAARGFESGPTGPFNAAADDRWTAGERASFAVAATNAPAIRPGATVRVSVYVGDGLLVRLSATAAGGTPTDPETVAVTGPSTSSFSRRRAPAPPSRWPSGCRCGPA